MIATGDANNTDYPVRQASNFLITTTKQSFCCHHVQALREPDLASDTLSPPPYPKSWGQHFNCAQVAPTCRRR